MDLRFSSLKRGQVETGFTGGDLTSAAGLPLLHKVDHKLGLTSFDQPLRY